MRGKIVALNCTSVVTWLSTLTTLRMILAYPDATVIAVDRSALNGRLAVGIQEPCTGSGGLELIPWKPHE